MAKDINENEIFMPLTWEFFDLSNLQRLGGLMSMTESVGLGLGSMSLPRRRRPGSSSSGEKMLLPLLVLGLWSVGLKLMGERKPWPCVRRARGNVLRPAVRKREIKLYRHTPGPVDK